MGNFSNDDILKIKTAKFKFQIEIISGIEDKQENVLVMGTIVRVNYLN